jgi:hypothetical protein
VRTQRQHPPMAAGEVVWHCREALRRRACSPRGRARRRRTVLWQCPFSRSWKIACGGVAATSGGSGPSSRTGHEDDQWGGEMAGP